MGLSYLLNLLTHHKSQVASRRLQVTGDRGQRKESITLSPIPLSSCLPVTDSSAYGVQRSAFSVRGSSVVSYMCDKLSCVRFRSYAAPNRSKISLARRRCS